MLDLRFGDADELRPFALTPLTIPVRIRLANREQLFRFVEGLGRELHEWLLAVFVDGDFGLLAIDTVAQGDARGVTVNFPRIFRLGLALNAKGLILVHNHPSGDARPSKADGRVTRQAIDIGEGLGIQLLEHFIIAGHEMRGMCWDGGAEVFSFGPASAR